MPSAITEKDWNNGKPAKKTKVSPVATVEDAAAEAKNRSVRDVVAALPTPELETAMAAEAETVADEKPVAEAANAPEIFIPLNKLKKFPAMRGRPGSTKPLETGCAPFNSKE
ncbi:hypothetical protein KXR64_22950 [Brucella intermedia]|uniref:hypothetical protein n=1 Tax=Brucella TaxID=234 RepID=UPI0009467AFE|nr:hypothetical protein [Brucella intermedia]